MKKNKLIIIIAASLVAVIAISLTVILCVGNDLKKTNNMIDSSRENFKQITTAVEVIDGEQTVYKYFEKIEMIDGNAEIAKETSKLNSSFDFSTVKDNQVVENANRKDFINFIFDKEYFEECKLKDGTLNLTVKGDKLVDFLSAKEIQLETNGENVSATFVFENKRLTTATLEFVLQSGKKVKLNMNCVY